MAPSPPSHYSQQPHFTVPPQRPSKTVKQQQHKHSSKSCSNIFLKSFVVMIVLVVIPLFPSQAPDFITQSVVTQFWELFHLLFIGIVVCYGLFCKRSSNKTYAETQHSRFDSSDAYAASEMSNVASIFDNGLENYCGSDEKRVIPNWDSQFLNHESRVQERFELVEGEKIRSLNENGAICGYGDKRVIPNWDSQFLNYEYSGQERSNRDEGEKSRSFSGIYGGQERSNLGEGEKSRSFSDIDGVENTEEFNEREVAKVWNNQYFYGESMVVVANGNYGVEKVSHIDHKPLGLPVRSLRDRAFNAEKTESIHEDSVNSEGSSGSIGYEVRGEKIRDMAPMNLRRKFEEASGPCQVSWRSRSQGGELEGVNTFRPPSHSRPHSVGQLEFGYLKSRSFSKPVSSWTSPTSSSPSITSPSSSFSSENGGVEIPLSDPHYAFDTISVPTSQQTGASIGEAAVLTSEVKESNSQSCLEMNVQLRDDCEEDEKKMKTNPSSREACHVQGHPHTKSHSAGETEFDHQEPWSFWNRVRSQIVSNSSSPKAIPPISATSPEMPYSRKQDPERLKNVKPPPVQVSQPTARSVNDAAAFVASKTRRSTVGSSSEFDMLHTSKDKLKDVTPVNGEATYQTSMSRAFGIGSSSEITMQESSKDKLKHVSKDLKQDSSYTQKQSVISVVSDVKQPVSAKNSSRGKSVRTFRSRRNYIDRSKRKVDCPKNGGEINEVSCDQFDAMSSLKCINREGGSKPPVNSRKGILDNSGPIPSSAFFVSEPEAKQHFANTDIVESKESTESKGNPESVLTNSQMSSDEEADFDLADDVDLGSEVDRKAGEFIAKFREQIRLQKIESFRRTSG
ncbi:hypothetical protein RND71_007507 [Anisodus tanguticus]|uniref:Uncharacterized protein n=1 Tax=Anisodus tanguticus TaxID=243964 RepID=A0AAE1SMH8_9SOLA|nr:hypothetical protein RND71_007507 [Anisodus tanguticus]